MVTLAAIAALAGGGAALATAATSSTGPATTNGDTTTGSTTTGSTTTTTPAPAPGARPSQPRTGPHNCPHHPGSTSAGGAPMQVPPQA